jgi:hypothetical protein
MRPLSSSIVGRRRQAFLEVVFQLDDGLNGVDEFVVPNIGWRGRRGWGMDLDEVKAKLRPI